MNRRFFFYKDWIFQNNGCMVQLVIVCIAFIFVSRVKEPGDRIEKGDKGGFKGNTQELCGAVLSIATNTLFWPASYPPTSDKEKQKPIVGRSVGGGQAG